jgi:uncharacterized membrane protein (UPF0182 family)
MPRRRRRTSSRGRVLLVVAIVVLFLLITSLRGVASFYTDYLWFDNLGLSSVFTGILSAKVALGTIFTLTFAVLCFVSLTVADRTAPTFRPAGPEDELLTRYHDFVAPRQWLVRGVVSLFFGLIAGVGQSSLWQQWILFTHAQKFGVKDATFHTDVGFYVFKLPFLIGVEQWLFDSLIIILLITLVADYLNGGIRPQSALQRVTPQVKAHVSVILAALALVKAVDYYLARYSLTFSSRGYVQGATYADVHASLPALELLLFIALLSCGLFIYNIWQRGWVLPAVAVGLWAFIGIIAGTAYPAFIESVRVKPSESTREAPYIKNNILASRQGMNLNDVLTKPYTDNNDVKQATQDVVDNKQQLLNIPLLDKDVVTDTYQKLQGYLAYTTFNSLVTDRYRITGANGENTETQVVTSSRDLNLSQASSQTWEGQHILYTHGYGVALAPSNAVTSSGEPNFLIYNVPTSVNTAAINVDLKTPQVYFTLGQSGYAVVDSSKEQEVDYLNKNGSQSSSSYTGTGGVALNSWVKRAAFALRFGDWNPIISSYVTPGSKILYVRDVQQRVQAVAPFLSWDSDPYPVLVDGKIEYIIDGYTTTNHYPNAQTADTTNLSNYGIGGKSFNYVRNSVKAVVDTYNGNVTIYVVDKKDPIIKAYVSAFPKLFDEGSIPQSIQDHFRYPEDLFTVQTNMWGRYHITDPQSFYSQTAGWSVAQDPGHDVQNPQQGTTTNQQGQTSTVKEQRVDPYYAMMKLPGDSAPSFQLFRSFVPFSQDDSKKTLTAFMTAESDVDTGNYGQLTVYQIPSDVLPDGPAIVGSNISSNSAVSQITSLLNQHGSTVTWGNLTVYPVGQSILYIRPLYVAAVGGTQVPRVQDVVVVFGSGNSETIQIKPTLQQALDALFPNAPDGTFDYVGLPFGSGPIAQSNSSGLGNNNGSTTTTTAPNNSGSTTTTTTPGSTNPSVPNNLTSQQLVAKAATLLAQAKSDLVFSCTHSTCDFNSYEKTVALVQAYLDKATAQENGAATTTTTAPSS